MSLDLKRETFLFGNIENSGFNFRHAYLPNLNNFIDHLTVENVRNDKSWPWRFSKNFKSLLDYNENKLFSNLQEFDMLVDLLYKTIVKYESLLDIKKYNFTSPVSEIDFFGINIVVTLNYFRSK